MNNQKHDFIIIMLFLTFLYVPSFCFYVFSNKEVTNKEKRELASFPDITKLDKFPKGFEDYYNDHLPWRSLLQESWSNLNFILFEEPINSDAIIGKKDTHGDYWLYYARKNDGAPLSDISGEKKYTDEDMKKIKEIISNNTLELSKRNIELYYLAIPNKSSIYTEFLPNMQKIASTTRLDKLNNYLISNGISNFFYAKETLLEAKKKYNTYYKTDSHWTSYGAYVTTMQLLNGIDKSLCTSECDEVIVEEKKVSNLTEEEMDLKLLLGLSLELEDVETKVTNFGHDKNVKKSQELYGKYNIDIFSCEEPISRKKVLFIGDSFRRGTYHFLPKIFSKIVYVHSSDFEKSLIKDYNPDIIIYEVVERYSNRLLNKIT